MFRQFVIPVTKKTRNPKTLEVKETLNYKCLYCSKEYLEEDRARKCVEEHDLVLVPISRNDLGRLNQFFYLKEDKLLTESLVRIVQKYARNRS